MESFGCFSSGQTMYSIRCISLLARNFDQKYKLYLFELNIIIVCIYCIIYFLEAFIKLRKKLR